MEPRRTSSVPPGESKFRSVFGDSSADGATESGCEESIGRGSNGPKDYAVSVDIAVEK